MLDLFCRGRNSTLDLDIGYMFVDYTLLNRDFTKPFFEVYTTFRDIVKYECTRPLLKQTPARLICRIRREKKFRAKDSRKGVTKKAKNSKHNQPHEHSQTSYGFLIYDLAGWLALYFSAAPFNIVLLLARQAKTNMPS